MALETKPTSHFWGNEAIIQVFGANDHFHAYLKLKLWLRNQTLDINSNPTKYNLGHFG